MRALNSNPSVDNSDPVNFPFGRIKNNDGTGNGTGVNENVYGDIHQTIAKLMALYGIVPNGLPDNVGNGYQIVEALSALASKNDYIYPLTTGSGVLNVNIKLSNLNTNEFIVCLAAADKTTETQIKGIGASVFPVTYSGNFKANEYVRIIKTVSGVSIIRLADWNSLDAMATDLLYLKKASQVEEDAGDSEAVATTPKVNKVTFAKRVNGDDSDAYRATAIQNGLYPKEHYEIVSTLGNVIPAVVGYIEAINVGTTSGSLVVVGTGIIDAIATNFTNGTEVIVHLNNVGLTGTSYYVRTFVRGLSSDMAPDASIATVVFKPINNTSFKLRLNEITSQSQSLRIYIEVIKF